MTSKKKSVPDLGVGEVRNITITAPNFKTLSFPIEGTSPYVQLRFSNKVIGSLLEEWCSDPTSQKGKKKERKQKNLIDEFKEAMYEMNDGSRGIPAACIRNAAISACRTVDFKMTLAKLSIFVEADGFDKYDGTPLFRIEGNPVMCQHAVRNANGAPDIRIRAMWTNWKANLRVRYDADQFTEQDIANLIMRVGAQVGIGEGRPSSKSSAGMGWGLFRIANDSEDKPAKPKRTTKK